MTAIDQLIERHRALLEEKPYAYFELAYTRATGWMAWICSETREANPKRKVIACGQGDTAEAACAVALTKMP